MSKQTHLRPALKPTEYCDIYAITRQRVLDATKASTHSLSTGDRVAILAGLHAMFGDMLRDEQLNYRIEGEKAGK